MGKHVTLGMVGCGNIGAELVEVFDERRAAIEASTGIDLRLTRIAVADPAKPRSAAVSARRLTGDHREVIGDPEIDIVVELVGDVPEARDIVLGALAAGKSVVTANKALVSAAGPELFAQARASDVDLLFEAAAVAAVPVVRSVRESLASEPVTRIVGILNGTSNYILSRMAGEGLEYADVLAQAQKLGYAEPDPTADVEGHDSAAKLALLASLAFRHHVDVADVHTEGISGVARVDLKIAHDFGYAVKSLGVAESEPGDGAPVVRAQVFPALVPLTHPLASVHDTFNAVFVTGADAGELMLYGRGAGQRPTASALLGDILDAATNRTRGMSRPPLVGEPAHAGSVADDVHPYYLRLELKDSPGVLSEVSGVFGTHGISLRVVEQHDSSEGAARVVFLTYPTTHGALRAAVADLDGHSVVVRTGQVLRIFGT
ncbi:MAG: homoserine dehydrogenase [Pseudonocardia sp.]